MDIKELIELKNELRTENTNLKKILELQKEENDNLKKTLKLENEDKDKLAKMLDDIEDMIDCAIEDAKSCSSSDFADGMIFILNVIKRQFKY
jgi:regulator of replication initiation timing